MKKSVYIFCLLVALGIFLAPLGNLFTLPSFSNFLAALNNSSTFFAVKNTVLISFGVATLSIFLAFPLAWTLTRTDLKGRQKFRSWLCMPYVIPPYVGAIGWIILANPTSGLLNVLFGSSGTFNIYSYSGLIWVETTFLFSFSLLSALTAFDNMDSSLEEAARISGANPFRVFWDIHIPLLKSTIAGSFILAFLATASSFGVPALIGGPARIYMLTTQIYAYQRTATENSLQMAIALSALLGVATLVLLYGANYIINRNHFSLISGKTPRPSLTKLGKWNSPIFFMFSIFLFLILVLPLLGIGLSAFSSVQGSWSFGNLNFSQFNRVFFETQETKRAFFNSISLGAGAALICSAFAFFIGYFTIKSSYPGKNLITIAIGLPFSTPGTVLGVSLILAFSRGYFGIGPSLYNTLSLILLAYFVKYASLSIKLLADGYGQIHQSLEEAATISGANWWQSMISVYLPILRPTLMASIFLVFIPALSELTMTILLTGPGLETIGTLIFQLQEYSDVGGGGAAVISLMVVFLTLTINFSLKYFSKGRFGL